jgi:hypothetical protein
MVLPQSNKALKNASFAEEVNELQRVSFRMGKYRRLGVGRDKNAGDLTNAGDPGNRILFK